MSKLDVLLREMSVWAGSSMKERLENELLYARRVSAVNGNKYDALIEAAFDMAKQSVARDGVLTDGSVLQIEHALDPMQAACKKYRLLMVGHAHIDMNWMWRYDETVSITLDTFRTALNLMKEFPQFTFAQSQASVYRIVEQFEPGMIGEIRERIAAGQWEVSASTWVEADRNMPSAESVARHFLYTKNYLPELLGVDAGSLNLDYEPDTFGHGENVPEMLANAGVKFYYHCRGEEEEILYRWRAPSGAEVLVYREPFWYLGPITHNMAEFVPEFCEKYGMNTAMRVYGVGDHGGGPTRRDLERIVDMGAWPIFPRVEFGTYAAFYQDADAVRESFPVLKGERNFIFTGCYTTQSRIKMGNRMGEKLMLEAEALNAFARARVGAEYDNKAFEMGWRNILFNQFHDIIPGSGVVDTREHAMGLYQEAYAVANTAKRNALAALSGCIDTSAFVPSGAAGGTSEGAGVGFDVYPFKLGQVERGGGNTSRIFHLYNPLPIARKTVTDVVLWDFHGDFDRIEIVDAQGNVARHQVLEARFEHYWQHEWAKLAIEVEVPALGYATYGLRLKDELAPKKLYGGDARIHKPFEAALENEYIYAKFDSTTGALVSLVDKETGIEVLDEAGAGFRLINESTDQGMTAWVVGRYMNVSPLPGDIVIEPLYTGELRKAISFKQKFARSKISYTVSLDAGSRVLNYDVQCDWLEVGDIASGIPQLNFGVHMSKRHDSFIYDVPGGIVRRQGRALDLPSQGMIAAEDGHRCTAVLLADSKYGFRGENNEMSVTLIRSAYEPDPYPELGAHTFRIALGVSHAVNDAQLVRGAQGWNHEIVTVSGGNHGGNAPLCASFMRLRADDVVMSGIKKCETDDGIILRGYEVNGHNVTVEVEFDRPVQSAALVDTLEREIGDIEIAGRRIRFPVKAKGLFSVKVTI